MFSCSKEGKTDESWQNNKKNAAARSGERNSGHTRCGCEAKITVKKSQDGDVWVVSYFVEQHNHALTTPTRGSPTKLTSECLEDQESSRTTILEANIPTSQQVRLFEIDAGGPSLIGCLEKDIRNHKRDVQSELFGHDAETLIHYFETEKERNENFYFSYETDDAGIFVRCFWVDSESRRSYAYFGDTVVFGTTYNTNKYSMVFAPFVGVNQHRQTIVFGCVLLSGEKIESFIWLFSKFLECMSAHTPPGIIITDQDAAITRAISKMFPGTLHRLCLWHILNKFSEKLSVVLYKEQYHKLVDIIKESESTHEFENRWEKLMNSTELGNNEWLSNMYTIRHRWVPAYVRHVFAAGLTSSQRVESNHSFFKRYVNHKNSLADFVTRFNRALVHQRHQELIANHVDLNEEPRMVTSFLMEQKMVSIYTKTMFLLFQKELQQCMSYICTLTSRADTTFTYTVKRFEFVRIFDRQRELTYCTSSDLILCSCQLFEFEGYPCRHMLCWMKVEQVVMLPNKYIIRRWTKKAKSAAVYEPTPNSTEGQSLISRRGALAHVAMELVDDCSLTEARTTFLMRELENLKIRTKDIDDGGNIDRLMNRGKSCEFAQVVQDPHPVRAKGCGKRLKSSKEKIMSQSSRTCSVCSQSGHDKRTCPSLLPISQPVVDPYYP